MLSARHACNARSHPLQEGERKTDFKETGAISFLAEQEEAEGFFFGAPGGVKTQERGPLRVNRRLGTEITEAPSLGTAKLK